MRSEKYIIEKRREDGTLDFTSPQPEDAFGPCAIQGITENEIANTVWRLAPDTPVGVMHGGNVSEWPAIVNASFIARRKTWG